MPTKKIKINRAPVLTLWAAVVAERLGHDQATALTLGKALAGLNAQSKGQHLGIYQPASDQTVKPDPKAKTASQPLLVPLMGRSVPAARTKQGLRATTEGEPITPESVQRYLEGKFGADLTVVQVALQTLARAYTPTELEKGAFALYEKFRPKIPEGTKGWGAKGDLDLSVIRSLASKKG